MQLTDVPPLDSPVVRPTSCRPTSATKASSTTLLLTTLARAIATNHGPWLTRYGWFVQPVGQLIDEAPGKPLDG